MAQVRGIYTHILDISPQILLLISLIFLLKNCFLNFVPWHPIFRFSLYIVCPSFISSFINYTFCLTSWESLRRYYRKFLYLKFCFYYATCYFNFFYIDFFFSFLPPPSTGNPSLNIMSLSHYTITYQIL